MADGVDLNLAIIEEVRIRPLLYDTQLPENSNKLIVERTWTEISKKLKIPVTELKEKWRNIRSSYVRSKKFRGKPKKPYYLSRYLEFLHPFAKPLRQNSETTETPIEDELDQDIQIITVKQSPGRSDGYDDIGDEVSDGDDDDPPSPQIYFPEMRVPQESPSRKRARHHDDVRHQDNTNVSTSSTRKYMHYFFASLLEEFDDMTDSEIRSFKIKVLQIIDDIKKNN